MIEKENMTEVGKENSFDFADISSVEEMEEEIIENEEDLSNIPSLNSMRGGIFYKIIGLFKK